MRLANFSSSGDEHVPKAFSADLEAALTPELLARMAEISTFPIVVQGVLRGDDARRCVNAGVRAIVVSNHGGRQLDGAIATADALPEVVSTVGHDAEVYVDGGIRTGTDIVRALALGARAVLIGRPTLWGLAIVGRAGVHEVLGDLRLGLERAMRLGGITSLADVPSDLLARHPIRS
jgi:4-hydroxymandelate oxidase